jgi:hypothetical protein
VAGIGSIQLYQLQDKQRAVGIMYDAQIVELASTIARFG